MKLTWANQITIVRILLILPFVICMMKANETGHERLMRYIALFIFMVMCVSDVLDGYLARVKKQVTTFGAFLDPMADKLLMISACVLLASTKTAIDGFVLPPTVVVVIIGKDIILLLGFITIYLVTFHILIIPVFAGKLCTFLQLSMVVAVLIGPEMKSITGIWFYVTRLLWWSAAAVAVFTTFVYIRDGVRYTEQFEEKANSKKG